MFAGSRGVGKRTSIYPSELRGLFTAKLVTKVSRFRLGTNLPDVMEAVTKFALRSDGVPPPKRLSEEISELGKQLDPLVAEAASEPLAMNGVSIDTAASLLITAGDHPERPRNGGDYLLGAGTFPPERLPAGVPERKDRVGRREAPAPRGDFPVMANR
jgi:hypothetical protein